MFIGHYAIALAATPLHPRRGTLSYFGLASILPDPLMLAAESTLGATQLNFHSDIGVAAVAAIIVCVGFLFRFDFRAVVTALFCLGSHLLLDIPYSAASDPNWYSWPVLDFSIETAMLLSAAILYTRFEKIHSRRRFLVMIILFTGFQAVWNFGFSANS